MPAGWEEVVSIVPFVAPDEGSASLICCVSAVAMLVASPALVVNRVALDHETA
jgi:hypothetical protein